MQQIQNFARRILLAGAFFLFAAMPTFTAAAAISSATPDPNASPVLAKLIGDGAKAFFLGSDSGFNGWFIVKNGQIQVAYTMAGSADTFVGVLFGPTGESITAEQMKALLANNKDAQDALTNIQRGQVGGAAAAAPITGPTPVASAPPSMSPATSPGERLMQALDQASGVAIGSPAAPRLLMVADPNCPHCQATWRMLRDAVFAGHLQVRLVPIGTENSDSERAAAELLLAANPIDVWDQYVVGGDKSKLAGSPNAAQLASVRANHMLVDSWHLGVTPYLVYRAKNGQVKVVQGEPISPSAMLDDISP